MGDNDWAETPWDRRFAVEADRLKALIQDAKAVRRALTPLTKSKTHENLRKLEKALSAAKAKLNGDAASRTGTASMLREFESWLVEAPVRLRQSLGREIKTECERRGLALKVLSRDDPVELRIPPFAVSIDFRIGSARLSFAKEILGECRADAAAILALHGRLIEEFGRDFDPQRFHELCLRAWRAARAADASETSRVEILTFLPHLALQMQSEKFGVEPSPRNFRGYTRARFAYDVLRLQHAGGLDQHGWRLSLGVATGSTAQVKKRVVYVENEDGVGEYKLTVYFVRTGAPT